MSGGAQGKPRRGDGPSESWCKESLLDWLFQELGELRDLSHRMVSTSSAPRSPRRTERPSAPSAADSRPGPRSPVPGALPAALLGALLGRPPVGSPGVMVVVDNLDALPPAAAQPDPGVHIPSLPHLLTNGSRIPAPYKAPTAPWHRSCQRQRS